MKIIQLTYDENCPISQLALCLGFFDGMHRAHQTLFRLTLEKAKECQVPSGIVTFSTHILSFLKQEPFRALTTVEDKIRLAEAWGFDYFIILLVSKNLISMSPETFIRQYLLDASHIVVGYDYTFGFRGEGTPKLLESALPGKVTITPCQNFYGTKVGSTRIRSLLKAGKLSVVNRLLKRPYQIRGRVVSGHGRGQHLGYPTANCEYDGYFLPRKGVYYTRVKVSDNEYEAMTSIGTNPTFRENDIRLETHLLDYSGDLYGREITVSFYEYIRPEKRFSSASELVRQLQIDEKYVRMKHSSKEESQ